MNKVVKTFPVAIRRLGERKPRAAGGELLPFLLFLELTSFDPKLASRFRRHVRLQFEAPVCLGAIAYPVHFKGNPALAAKRRKEIGHFLLREFLGATAPNHLGGSEYLASWF